MACKLSRTSSLVLMDAYMIFLGFDGLSARSTGSVVLFPRVYGVC